MIHIRKVKLYTHMHAGIHTCMLAYRCTHTDACICTCIHASTNLLILNLSNHDVLLHKIYKLIMYIDDK